MSRTREIYWCETGYIWSHFSQNNATLKLYISKKVLILRMRLKIVEMDTLTKEEVQSFLEQFHAKLKIFGIIYRDDRGKNQKTLEELEIKPSFRTVVIESLQTEDYIEGPVVDKLNMLGDMWVFGKDVKGREVYIKIMLSGHCKQTICISFHLAEHPLTYQFK